MLCRAWGWDPIEVSTQDEEKWMALCAQASKEQDPHRLIRLIEEINRLLEEKERRLGLRKGEASGN